MKIVAISDTHCRLRNVSIPDGDVLVHAGDLTFQGNIQEISQELRELGRYTKNFKKIILCAGNHDWLPQRNEPLMRQMCKDNGITYLQDESITVDGVKVYCSPHQPEFCGWAFNLPRGLPLKEKWDLIPDDTDVLVTHGPPYGIMDVVPYPPGFHAGCEDLYRRVMAMPNLRLHVFGHIHSGHGSVKIGNTTFINASICTEEYKPVNKPFIVSI